MAIDGTELAVLETALYVDDLDAAAAFYIDLIGLPVVSRHPTRQIFLKVAGGVLILFNPVETRIPPDVAALPVPPHGSIGEGHVCFAASAAEIDAWKAKFVAQGVEIEADFNWPNGARSIYLRDPAGNSVEFAEPSLWGLHSASPKT